MTTRVDEYLFYLKAILSKSSCKSYRTALRHFLKWNNKGDLTEGDLVAYKLSLSEFKE